MTAHGHTDLNRTAPGSAAPPPSWTRRRQTLGDVLSSEWIKLLTTRGALILPLGALALPLLVMVATVAAARDPGGVNLSTAAMSTFAVTMVIPVAAVTSALTADMGHGTLRVTYAATPRRGRVVAAKVVVSLTYVAVVLASVMVVTVAAGAGLQAMRGAPIGLDADGPTRLCLGIAVACLYTLGALALAYLLRTTAAAVTLVALYPFAEGIARDLLRQSQASAWAQWFPVNAALDAAMGVTDVPSYGIVTLGRPWGILYLAAQVAVVFAAAALRELRRDT